MNGGAVKDITIISDNYEAIVGKWDKQVIQKILQKQSLDIQGVSGATVTTRALQKTAQNAIMAAL